MGNGLQVNATYDPATGALEHKTDGNGQALAQDRRPRPAPARYCASPCARPDRLLLGRGARRIDEYDCAPLGRKSRP